MRIGEMEFEEFMGGSYENHWLSLQQARDDLWKCSSLDFPELAGFGETAEAAVQACYCRIRARQIELDEELSEVKLLADKIDSKI